MAKTTLINLSQREACQKEGNGTKLKRGQVSSISPLISHLDHLTFHLNTWLYGGESF